MWLTSAVAALVVGVASTDVATTDAIDRRVHAELADESGWSRSHKDGTVQVSRKHLYSVDTTAWKGQTTLPPEVSRTRVFEVLQDTEFHKSFNRSLRESVVLDRTDGVTTFYQVLSPPAYVPLSQRWWVCRAINNTDADGTPGHLRRMWSSLPDSEAASTRASIAMRYPNAVEVPFTHGRWDLEPLPDGSTRLTYRIATDPGGGVPRAIASRFAGRSVADTMRAMVQAAAQK